MGQQCSVCLADIGKVTSGNIEDPSGELQKGEWLDFTELRRSLLESQAQLAVITPPEEVQKQQLLLIEEVAELLDVPTDTAVMLLRNKAWDKDSVSESYFEDSETTLLNAGVVESTTKASSKQVAPESNCMICFSEAPMALLPCGHHSYCRDCWRQYVKTSVQEGAACMSLKCPTAKCPARLRPNDFRELCDSTDLERYLRFDKEDFVNRSRRYAWCPGPRCSRIARLPAVVVEGSTDVECPCGTRWCAGCKMDSHAPVSCEVVKEWNSLHQNADDQWISMNTKPCPKCKRPIEKNGGCMHMTCAKASGCGHEFCWICLAPWSLHGTGTGGFYACNRYKPKDDGDSAREKAARYFHFCDRFFGHEKAQHFAETDQSDAAKKVMQLFTTQGSQSVKRVEFLEEAVNEICNARRFLKWTYAYAFVLKMTLQRQELFDFQQSQLENHLERLSDCMERTPWELFARSPNVLVEGVPFEASRSQVLGLLGVLRQACSTLASSIENDTA